MTELLKYMRGSNKFFWEISPQYVGKWGPRQWLKAPTAYIRFMILELKDFKNRI